MGNCWSALKSNYKVTLQEEGASLALAHQLRAWVADAKKLSFSCCATLCSPDGNANTGGGRIVQADEYGWLYLQPTQCLYGYS
jgi:hypothetical protein